MTECIHGFEDGLCDICFPRQRAEPVAVATAVRAPRRTTTSAPRVSRVAGLRPSPAPNLPPFGKRRLYHWTHSRNLESILLDGALLSVAAGASPDVDVAAPLVRRLRNAADVGDGRTVDSFVPFSLSPDADRWAELRAGAEESHWSAAARLAAATEYVMLVVAADALGTDLVVADGDASAPATRFQIGDPARALVRAAREDPELDRVELLVPDRVPLDAVLLIGVPNDPARSRVRAMFDAVDGTPPRVVVHPPWFVPAV